MVAAPARTANLEYEMSESRNNHYVPCWHQRAFCEPGRKTLAYLDLAPKRHALANGEERIENSRFDNPPKRCFVQRDLYSTFFGATVNDEIERELFGAIDNEGPPAVQAFIAEDPEGWREHFETLFSLLDMQNLRTPKGLDWLKDQYPSLSQNDLMMEMQGIQAMNCTIWSEAVREIVSAEDADVKFLLTDHPVTAYNSAISPGDALCAYPDEPSIALKGTQTLFPLDRDHCLILTNLEYAKDAAADPLQKRTFARNFRQTWVRSDALIRSRKLTNDEVIQVNAILKARARRYIAAGRAEWLHPERETSADWRSLGEVLRPPEDGLFHFGGELIVGFEDGTHHFQDEFGRSQKPFDALQKIPPERPRDKDACACGAPRTYAECCKARPAHRRPSWTELSIRERNIGVYRATMHIVGVDQGKTWDEVRRDLTDGQISELYGVFAAFWPLETDLLSLLPKPDGRPRAVYTGTLHPALINEFALGASLYFGELLIQHPFIHAGAIKKAYSPTEKPQLYRQEVLKAVLMLSTLFPLVDCGFVNLIPDPCSFDPHLGVQMFKMAKDRGAGLGVSPKDDARAYAVMREDMRRSLMLMPRKALERRLPKQTPGLEDMSADEILDALEARRQADPLSTLQPDSLGGGEDGGQFTLTRLQPNFEMAMYLAQATGAGIVTDSPFRWAEIKRALLRRWSTPHGGAPALARAIEAETFVFPQEELDAVRLGLNGDLAAYPPLFGGAFGYLRNRTVRGAKPNFETQLAARFGRVHAEAQARLRKAGFELAEGKLSVAMPAEGIIDNTVNRLLLMSSSEHHLGGVPMAMFIQRPRANDRGRA